MDTKFSAYLSIYNDWDILPWTLRSIAPYIDELVVVDGAYRWMAPYARAIGNDPLKSDQRVYQALEGSGVPFRVISELWPTEIEKRKAGYLACRHRYRFRVDADEIYFFNSEPLADFLRTGGAAAEMEMPVYVAPGWIVSERGRERPGRQGFLFDSEKISAEQHLLYLWLVLTTDQLPPDNANRSPVFGEPVAYNAHLSHWRTPTTAVGRAAFYVFNWVRRNGVPWLPELSGRPLDDLGPLFERVTPEIMLDILRGHPIVVGFDHLEHRILTPSLLAPPDEETFAPVFEHFLKEQAAANRSLHAPGRYVVDRTYIDLSSEAAVRSLTPDAAVAFRVGSEIHAWQVKMHYLVPREPWEVVRDIVPAVGGKVLEFDIPPDDESMSNWLRRVLTMEVWCKDGSRLRRLECLAHL